MTRVCKVSGCRRSIIALLCRPKIEFLRNPKPSLGAFRFSKEISPIIVRDHRAGLASDLVSENQLPIRLRQVLKVDDDPFYLPQGGRTQIELMLVQLKRCGCSSQFHRKSINVRRPVGTFEQSRHIQVRFCLGVCAEFEHRGTAKHLR